MAIFKQFNTNEVVITPFHANKGFRYVGSQITASNVGIEYYQSMQGAYTSGSHPTGFTTVLDKVLVFNSIKQLYYGNYLTASTGDNIATSSLIPGATPEYNSNVGITTGPRFDNFLQSSLQQDRQFAQFSASTAITGPSVITIPSKLFGEKIPPSTFNFTYTSSTSPYIESFVHDDSEGNLVATQSNQISGEVVSGSVGEIFYSQGMAVLTGIDSGDLTTFATLVGSDGVGPTANIDSASLAFSSSITIRENQYKCTIRDNEYSYTTNPSALRPLNQLTTVNNAISESINTTQYNDDGDPGVYTLNLASGATSEGIGGTVNITVVDGGGSPNNVISNITTNNPGRNYAPGDTLVLNPSPIIPNATGLISVTLTTSDVVNTSNNSNQGENYYDFATGSYFSPYVTTIGLYNESYQLVAVGKLAQPIPISLYTDTTFVVNFDT
jgi:hypothetical protein